MKRFVKPIAATLTVALLAVSTVPARSEARSIGAGIGGPAARHARDEVADIGIAIGAAAVALFMVGGAIWYYLHRRTESAPVPPPMAAPSRTN